jgi:hypothetical protein
MSVVQRDQAGANDAMAIVERTPAFDPGFVLGKVPSGPHPTTAKWNVGDWLQTPEGGRAQVIAVEKGVRVTVRHVDDRGVARSWSIPWNRPEPIPTQHVPVGSRVKVTWSSDPARATGSIGTVVRELEGGFVLIEYKDGKTGVQAAANLSRLDARGLVSVFADARAGRLEQADETPLSRGPSAETVRGTRAGSLLLDMRLGEARDRTEGSDRVEER